jgi:hypothetical protein
MEMGWIVIIEEHSKDDSIKATNFRHSYTHFTSNRILIHLANVKISCEWNESAGLRRSLFLCVEHLPVIFVWR